MSEKSKELAIFETKILAAAVQNYTHYQRLKRIGFGEQDFTTEHNRQIWKAINGAGEVGDYTVDILTTFIDTKIEDPQERVTMIRTLKALAVEDLKGYDLSVEALQDSKSFNDAYRALQKRLTKFTQASDWRKTLNSLSRELTLAASNKLDAVPTDFYGNVRARNAQRKNAYVNFHKGLKCIDEFACLATYFDPFFAPETITTIEGKTNSGKSVLLTNIMKMALKPQNGLNCLYLYSENRAIEAEGRLDAILLDVPYKESVKKRELTDAEIEQIENMPNNGWGFMFSKRLPYGHSTVEDIKRYLAEYEEKNINIDVVFLDSPDHMKASGKSDTWWLGKLAVYEEIKACAEQFKVSFFCTRQTKGSTSSKEIDAYSGKGGEGIPAIVDNQIIIDYDPKENMLSGIRKLVIVKCRDGVLDYKRHVYRIKESLVWVPEVSAGIIALENSDNKDHNLVNSLVSPKRFKLKKPSNDDEVPF